MATVSAGEDVKQVHRESHPFISKNQIDQFVGKTVAFVGRVEKVEDSTLFMTTEDQSQVKIIKFKGDADKFQAGAVMEIRGIVNKDNTLSFGKLDFRREYSL